MGGLLLSGDGGYGPHFKEVGEKYGPFDFAFVECGQYYKLWLQIHLLPEESVQAAIDAKVKVAMPIHWGGFKLALHPWKEPIERITLKAAEVGLPLCTPQIGAIVEIDGNYPVEKWWEAYD